MNITYIFGNGFDRHIGLKTSYQSFYKYYIKCPSSSPIVKELKNSLVVDAELWADFEVGLGEFCTHIKNTEDLDCIIRDIESALTTYLKNEELKVPTISESVRKCFFDDMLDFEKYINQDDLYQYRSQILKKNDSNININIITFNYTHSIERLVGSSTLPINIKENAVLSQIEHVHGELGDIILFGVDNTSQIQNALLQKDNDVADLICKPNINVSAERGATIRSCEDIINNTDVFVLFGLSCGVTDAYWWQQIANKLGEGNTSFVFIFNYEHSAIERRKLSIYKRNIKDRIMNHLSESYSRDYMNEYYELMAVPMNRSIFECVKGLSITM